MMTETNNKKEATTERTRILDTANQIVNGVRNDEYGSPEDNFTLISELWGSYLDEFISPIDVSNMMILLKVARIRSGRSTRDSFVDIAGYAACGGEISERMREVKKDVAKLNYEVKKDFEKRQNANLAANYGIDPTEEMMKLFADDFK